MENTSRGEFSAYALLGIRSIVAVRSLHRRSTLLIIRMYFWEQKCFAMLTLCLYTAALVLRNCHDNTTVINVNLVYKVTPIALRKPTNAQRKRCDACERPLCLRKPGVTGVLNKLQWILSQIEAFSIQETYSKIISDKRLPFCSSLNVSSHFVLFELELYSNQWCYVVLHLWARLWIISAW